MLSIVIPTKNEETFLPILLASIRGQTRQPQEIIVADAHSDDHTCDIARSFGCRIVEGGMPGPGRNRGAEAAHGDFVLFLDADVQLRDRFFLQHAMEEIQSRELDFATCDVIPLSHRPVDRLFHGFYNKYSRLTFPLRAHAPGFCIFARKHMHEQMRGFDETVVFCEDHDYAQRCRQFGSFGYLNHTKIYVSIRRFDRDGRLAIAVKYTLGELHLMALGPVRHQYFHYEFGHKKSAVHDAEHCGR
ncbi:MAG: putative glycosyltransferase [Candidatus Uhrbacteria bacterium GW2011_GWF2_41_16]|uniref:Putative glycosyltransferase n=2 Tax=Candidatus Uhriibacteriota TaxID=1752732 RepID=A0A0G0V8Z0_9BACT|nr:MAG: putative glycosyltransferase [Candidatus Uhrbacteria bacterium GW2011_GWC2_41_11]KKR97429.1 MAG: putative glycosyltransferase [Candidatus Uhrbacteria bacterium GW2011_GWF2_41_16]HBP00088.1 glycosyl transferase family 2 [Candidatus Uhrbacteria bacterium]